MAEPLEAPTSSGPLKWAKVIDHQSCVGCHACTTACKSENEVPLSVNRTYVKYADVGVFPQARRSFQVTRCNQCEDPPCTIACPTMAMHQRPDGIVDFDKSICIGCKACIASCPFDAIFINPEDHSAEKCNFCAHRLDVGLEPACVVVCPTEAIMVGDMNDSNSRVAQMVYRQPVAVRRPEKETHPKLFYRGAHQATLDPLAAQRPPGGIFIWSQQQQGGQFFAGAAEGLLKGDDNRALDVTQQIEAGAGIVGVTLEHVTFEVEAGVVESPTPIEPHQAQQIAIHVQSLVLHLQLNLGAAVGPQRLALELQIAPTQIGCQTGTRQRALDRAIRQKPTRDPAGHQPYKGLLIHRQTVGMEHHVECLGVGIEPT